MPVGIADKGFGCAAPRRKIRGIRPEEEFLSAAENTHPLLDQLSRLKYLFGVNRPEDVVLFGFVALQYAQPKMTRSIAGLPKL